MLFQFFPFPLFWDLMGLFFIGLVGWVIIWHISRGLAWFASAVGTGAIAAILLLAIVARLAGLVLVDPLDDLFYTLLFWLALHLISTLVFMRRIHRPSENTLALPSEETKASQADPFPALVLHS